MNKRSILACLVALVAGAAFQLACDSNPVDRHLPPDNNRLAATLMSSAAEVPTGPPGAYYISEDRTKFHLRCPGGNCTKSAVLPLVPGSAVHVWQLTGEPGKPSLTPSIHWFETDGVTTHWHGWLRNGYFEQ